MADRAKAPNARIDRAAATARKNEKASRQAMDDRYGTVSGGGRPSGNRAGTRPAARRGGK